MKNIVPVIILCFGVTVASPALCQKKKAKVLFDAGVAALEQKNYSKALQSFEAAYDMSPHWAVLAHIGTCHMKLDQPAKAIETFEKYLREGGDKIPADERNTAEEMIAQQKRKLGVLVLSVGKEGVEALVDGKSIGKSPFDEIVLSPGKHEIAVAFSAGDIVKRDITLLAGQEFILRIEQETHVATTPQPPTANEETSPKEPESSAAESESLPIFSAPPAQDGIKGSPVPFAMMLALSIADLVAAGVSWGFFIYYKASADNYKYTLDGMSVDQRFADFTWEETCSQKLTLDTEVYFCNTELNRRDFLKKADTWKIVGIATSAALAVPVTLTIVFGLNRHWFGGSKGESASLSILPMLGPHENGLMLNVSF